MDEQETMNEQKMLDFYTALIIMDIVVSIVVGLIVFKF
ncbi:gp527 [Bacillus phage G]|uniref:Gp527 n=1 Tax=Bacillus phage G TaxID=2884420 RepID=G3MAR8_9CAUD|nr:gp527 [Bacillus phage G]AEO93785.1 gp527 [Bacillus phage G]